MEHVATTHSVPVFRPVRPLRGFLNFLLATDAGYRQRLTLERLAPHLQRDIGLTDAEIRKELGRPMWDAPVVFRQR